ncbi:MAG: riboflavin biosynthesis protein RibD [Deltaproteobacteria bacterium RIFCSPLOWO2_12_FULL_43_16]|nr:MAG: riboflavin biosynthesis protein RibD [Deltaproteobacteria bacterium GWA2_43_19]OGQ10677.1 MAG: riboflavin biosynthesis protein RibD [Deltaproteobacteria bacterium RIFCSPHIGHO2_02_FULL_43_33]OGQ58658.1 MAG: riboflavin biosynthesis protein RibD [Deltaproteobacteria bacterium RIFCSPLOWO2_12_FULL_43_16]
MRMAIALARKGIGKTSPNPAVGAVIVKNGRIVGRGYHRKAGLAHAEINALREAGIKAKGADIYITLEPCNHFGRTPPCAEAIVRAGIKNIFIGMKDPNPLVAGKGITRLKNAGIKVETGILEQECKYINEAYIKYIITKTPFVTLKLASTLDGKIATASGESKWITGETARRYAHRMRAEADAVMVGIGTVIADDPELTVRLVKGKNPVRIVVDSRLRMPANAKILNQHKGSVIIATIKKKSQESEVRNQEKKIKALNASGADVLLLHSRNGKVDLKALMKELGKREITSLIIEGGGSLAASAIKEGIVDKITIFVAPKFFGKEGLSMIGELGIRRLKDAICLSRLECRKLGDDLLLEGYLKP